MKKEMLINVLQPEECRIAIVEDGILEELYVERTSLESYTGNIYKGKIVNLEPAIQAAFVDFSVGRNGFLHVSDVEPQYYERHQAETEPPAREPRRPAAPSRDRDRPVGDDRDRPRAGASDRDRDRPAPEDRDRPRAGASDRDRDRPGPEDRDRRPSLEDRDRRPAPEDRDRPRISSDRERDRIVDERPRPADRDRDRPNRLAEDRESIRSIEARDRLRALEDQDTFGAGLPPLYPDERPRARDRDRDRDRPDRSEKGRRDRSNDRRFGEGLIDDWSVPPAPRPLESRARLEPIPEPVVEPEPVEPEPLPTFESFSPVVEDDEPEIVWGSKPSAQSYSPAPVSPPPAAPAPKKVFEQDEPEIVWTKPAPEPYSWNPEPPPRGRTPIPTPPPAPEPVAIEEDLPPSRTARARETWPTEVPPPPTPRGRAARPTPPHAPLPPQIELPADDWEENLPPSRTARSRSAAADRTPPAPPPARAIEPEIEELVRPRSPRQRDDAEELDAESSRVRDRRGRPTTRGRSKTSEIEPSERTIDVPAPIIDADLDEIVDSPPRRAGREAIRSRGGDRPPERPRPAPKEALPPIETLIRPPVDPIDPPAPRDPRRRPRATELPEPVRPERPRPAPRNPESIDPPSRPQRPKPTHTRAGEPGYVPRRERTVVPEPIFYDDQDADLDSDADLDLDLDDNGTDSGVDDGSKGDSRRRRRGRGRRRRPKGEATAAQTAGDLDSDLDFSDLDEEDVPQPARTPAPAARRPEPPSRRKPAPAAARPDDDFDFDEEPTGRLAIDDDHDDHDDDDEFDDEDDDHIRQSDPDDVIDPELEEEIRREAEEIAELEREMGLRGPVEARPRRGEAARGRGGPKPPLQDIFRRGDEVLVQVIKESIGNKGPTLSTYISIPGRYLVLMPGLNRVGVSRKIADEGQRKKLRELMTELNPPKGLGFIVRTAGLDRTKRELARDLAYLLRLWKVILRRIKKSRGPAPIYQESDMITRTIRDIFNAEIDTIWIDEPQAFERAQEFLRVVMPRFVSRLKLYTEKVPLFHKYGLEEEIAKIQRRQVPLPEGGSIVIDQTEALVAIDVNSGNFRVENDAERTAYEMNLRAAKEIARQLRLRDMGGVIVNDFIDMREEKHRRGVEKALRDAIKRDRARTKVLRMSAFGLIEMTRQRIRPSLKRSVYEDCSNCSGAGVIKTVESMSIDVMRLLALAAHRDEVRRINVAVSVPVATYLNNRKRLEIAKLETEGTMTIHVRPEEDVPAEHLHFECYDAANNEVRVLPAPPAPTRRAR